MRKFNFRLQQVEEVYRVREQHSQRKLAKASVARQVERQKLEALQSEYDIENGIQREQVRNGYQAGDALLQHRYGEKLKLKTIASSHEVERHDEIVVRKRRELTEAMQRRQVLETLHERKLTEHKLNEQRENQFELDDQAARQFSKSKKMRSVRDAE